ncbi:MAG: hypothetical protein HC927_13280 [Deltaproteobacteria bacterium]|nr:hypothetical protein [Deltaproteobacteria bacterium]
MIEPAPPPGYEWFDCYFPNYGLDRSGAVLFELRDPSAAQFFAYSPEQQSWTPLGKPIALVDDISLMGGTGSAHVLTSAEQFTTFCPMTEWAERRRSRWSGRRRRSCESSRRSRWSCRIRMGGGW